MVRAAGLRVLPRTRGECKDEPRPCPYVTCRHHLLLDIARDGRLYVTRDMDEADEDSVGDALEQMPQTCALDVADRGGMFEEDVAGLLNLTRTHIADIETAAKRKIRRDGHELDDREHPEDSYIRHMEGKR